jgi:hypothetical protein
MASTDLASCQMIPQDIVVSIAGDVHFDGLILAVVLVLLAVIRKKL